MTNTKVINKVTVNTLLESMQDIRDRGNYPTLMYSCEDKELFVDEFIDATDYYNYPDYVKYISTIRPATISDILDLIEEMQEQYDYEKSFPRKEVM